MKKADVKIGGVYSATVSGKRVEVRIDAEKPRGGWDATNLATSKKIHIKSGQRLQAASNGKRQAKAATEENASVTLSEEIAEKAAVVESAPAPKPVLKKPRRANVAPADGEKKLSCVAAAIKVLGESTEPLNTKEMIAAMESKGYWISPGGKTPHATLYSAILRDLAAGDAAKFVKTERGRFAVRT